MLQHTRIVHILHPVQSQAQPAPACGHASTHHSRGFSLCCLLFMAKGKGVLGLQRVPVKAHFLLEFGQSNEFWTAFCLCIYSKSNSILLPSLSCLEQAYAERLFGSALRCLFPPPSSHRSEVVEQASAPADRQPNDASQAASASQAAEPSQRSDPPSAAQHSQRADIALAARQWAAECVLVPFYFMASICASRPDLGFESLRSLLYSPGGRATEMMLTADLMMALQLCLSLPLSANACCTCIQISLQNSKSLSVQPEALALTLNAHTIPSHAGACAALSACQLLEPRLFAKTIRGLEAAATSSPHCPQSHMQGFRGAGVTPSHLSQRFRGLSDSPVFDFNLQEMNKYGSADQGLRCVLFHTD